MTVLFLVMFSYAQGEELYNLVGTLKGQITFTNNPELGRIPASGQYFLLQRDGCQRCLIGVRADIEGRFVVFVGIGKYRIVCYDPETSRDLIKRGQAREVNVTTVPNGIEINIELELSR